MLSICPFTEVADFFGPSYPLSAILVGVFHTLSMDNHPGPAAAILATCPAPVPAYILMYFAYSQIGFVKSVFSLSANMVSLLCEDAAK